MYRKPRYHSDSDYTTNANSYYDDLARKQGLIKELAKRIWEYEKKLNTSLENIETVLNNYIDVIDGKIKLIDYKINEGFNEEINRLLVKWVEDGTIDHIINEKLMNQKVDREELKKYTDPIYWKPNLKEIENIRDYTPQDFYRMVENIQHPYFNIGSIGADESGEFTIRRYVYEPENFEKTILVVGGTHGSEYFTPYFTMKFIQMLVDEEGKVPPQLGYIKNKVRIIFIPILNPWGMYQTPKLRQNANGVDINRNFDYRWEHQPNRDPFDYDYKGEAPFSESEARAVKRALSLYSDISLVVDLHNFGGTAGERESRHYVVFGDEKTYKTNKRLLDYLTRNESDPNYTLTTVQNDSSLNNYTSAIWGIPSVCLEALPGRYGTMFGLEDTEKWFELFGNALILLTRSFGGKQNFFTRNHVANYGTVGQVIGETETLLTEGTFKIPHTKSGMLIVQGFVSARKTEHDSFFGVRPILEQEGFITQRNTLYSPYTQGLTVTLPINMMIPIRAGEKQAELKLYAINEGAGECRIRRFNIQIGFIAGLNDYPNSLMNNHQYVVYDD